MWLSFLSISLIAITSASSAVLPRDAADITSEVQTVSDRLITLNDTVTSFEAGLVGTVTALKILSQSSSLNGAIEDATEAAEESEPLNEADSQTVAFAVLELAQVVYSVLDNIVAKKPEFDRAILGIISGVFLVRGTLEKFQASTNEFGDALTPKLSETFQELAPIVLGEINTRFDGALAVYQ